MPTAVLDGFLEATVRSATPLAFAALGELVAERSGVMNIGLEGAIAAGALAAFLGAQIAGPEIGFVAGGVAGALVAAVFAFFVLALRSQQIIVGAAVSMLGIGLSASIHRAMVSAGASTAQVQTLASLPVPGLSTLPVVGDALFAQPISTYLLYFLFPLTGWVLYHTVFGVALRATGERPLAVVAAGHSAAKIQLAALIFGGVLAGLGGATLVVAQTGTFSDGMSAGRGFIAIAIVALGRWTPRGVVVGVLVFGAVSALQFLAQAMAWNVPYTLVLASPYVLTLAAMAIFRGSRTAPAALGQPLDGGL
ncbi:MAG: ABC transporter permease [Gemmatimonadetes bacterium]|nr:ABC transporter permease [Gemmatimonadota bacterium]